MLGAALGDESAAFLKRFLGVFSRDSSCSVTDDKVGAALLYKASLVQSTVVVMVVGLP